MGEPIDAVFGGDQKESKDEPKSEEKSKIAIAFSAEPVYNDNWCLDSGATSHMCRDENKFIKLIPVINEEVRLAVNKTTKIKGRGTVRLIVSNGAENKTLNLENTLCVPELKTNLLSISKSTSNGRSVRFTETHAEIINPDGLVILSALREGDLYFVKPNEMLETERERKENHLKTWHDRYCHLNESELKNLVEKDLVKGVSFKVTDEFPICEICLQGRQPMTPFPKSSRRSEKPLAIVHSDIRGPMRTISIGGAKYFVTFIDDESRWIEIYFIKSKAELKDAFVKYKEKCEASTESQLQTLRTDIGLEFLGLDFDDDLQKSGVLRERTATLTPGQSGIAKRLNRTLVQMARCMLLQSNLPQMFWAEAVATAVYIRNRSPTRSLDGGIPFTLWFNKKPEVCHFRTFGCKAFVKNKISDKKNMECIFTGYALDSKAYRLWDPERRKIMQSKEAKFVEILQPKFKNRKI